MEVVAVGRVVGKVAAPTLEILAMATAETIARRLDALWCEGRRWPRIGRSLKSMGAMCVWNRGAW